MLEGGTPEKDQGTMDDFNLLYSCQEKIVEQHSRCKSMLWSKCLFRPQFGSDENKCTFEKNEKIQEEDILKPRKA